MKKIILILISFVLLNSTGYTQHGGIGLKIGSPNYTFADHPDYSKLINTLYISVRLSSKLTLFIDSYLFETEGEAFATGLGIKTPMLESKFSDKATVLGPLYHQKLGFYDLVAYFGAGFGWHSLRIGYRNESIKETSKNHGAHLLLGVSYDIKKIPVVAFVEGRYARIYLYDESADPKFEPSPLHRAGNLDFSFLAAGLLVYFF